ncbi:MAG: acyl-CoA dehydrogenase family protein [Candidatus Riflebacteria bacterium]|nr:acyl-CoA dehydrogenase family protein [Candidatus Riflebacteria bacterium]
MDFDWTNDQIEFRKMARDFAEREIRPVAAWIEGRDQPNGLGNFPRELLQKMGKAGFMSCLHDKEFGGNGKGLLYECIIAEEFGAVSPAAELARLVSCALFGMPLAMFGTKEQKAEFLPKILAGELIGAIGITEPNVGSDTAGMKTTAILDGDTWVINGEKRFITNGSQADVLSLFAITDPTVKAHKGMSTFLFETKTPGFSVVKNYEMHGMHGMRVSHLAFNNCRIPRHRLLGQLNQGFKQLMMELDKERIALAAESLGMGRACIEAALKFSQERVQFGKPIKDFEGISFKIAENATLLEASQLMVHRAACKADKNLPCTKEAAMAKLFACDEVIRICDDCIQILGGTGYTCDSFVEQFYRDARLMSIGGGTREIMKYLISREVYSQAGYSSKGA